MRLSRWGRSVYETEREIAVEAAELSEHVQVVEANQDAEILVIHSKVPFGAAELERAASAQLVITTTSGTEHIDLAALAARRVVAARLPLARRDAVVETTVGMLMWGLRRWGSLDAAARGGEWARGALPELAPRMLRGTRIGLVGLGIIGREVARVLSLLGVEVWGADPRGVPESVHSTDVDTLLAECAGVSLHCDLNPSSRRLIGPERLERCRPGLVLVNTARGPLVDTDAAISALDRGLLGALCLDVFEEEPYPSMDAVSGRAALWLHPHAAGYHSDLAAAVRRGLLAAVTAFIRGDAPPHTVGSI